RKSRAGYTSSCRGPGGCSPAPESVYFGFRDRLLRRQGRGGSAGTERGRSRLLVGSLQTVGGGDAAGEQCWYQDRAHSLWSRAQQNRWRAPRHVDAVSPGIRRQSWQWQTVLELDSRSGCGRRYFSHHEKRSAAGSGELCCAKGRDKRGIHEGACQSTSPSCNFSASCVCRAACFGGNGRRASTSKPKGGTGQTYQQRLSIPVS